MCYITKSTTSPLSLSSNHALAPGQGMREEEKTGLSLTEKQRIF